MMLYLQLSVLLKLQLSMLLQLDLSMKLQFSVISQPCGGHSLYLPERTVDPIWQAHMSVINDDVTEPYSYFNRT